MDALEQKFVELCQILGDADRKLVSRILIGCLSGRIELSLDEAQHLSRSEWQALANCLPSDSLKDWISCNRGN